MNRANRQVMLFMCILGGGLLSIVFWRHPDSIAHSIITYGLGAVDDEEDPCAQGVLGSVAHVDCRGDTYESDYVCSTDAVGVEGKGDIICVEVHKKIVIFDLADFITEDTRQIIRKIGVGKMAGYTLTHWRNPIDACLDMLAKMGIDDEHKSSVVFMYKERRMPDCIVAWQKGECLHCEVKNKLLSYADKVDKDGFFSSKKEKEMTQAIIEIAFDPSLITVISKPMLAMVKIAHDLKKRGYVLYGVANIAQDVYEHIARAYPEIIALFDGLVTSHQTHALKSSKKLFEHLLVTYNLDPAHCLVIDKEQSALQVAEGVGMMSMQFCQQKNLRTLLKKQGIL